MQHIVDRNQEVLNNFIKAIEELAILRDNLLKKEVRSCTHSCFIFLNYRTRLQTFFKNLLNVFLYFFCKKT